MFRNSSLLSGSEFVSSPSPAMPVRGYVSAVVDEVSESRRMGSVSFDSPSQHHSNRRTPGSVRRERYEEPAGLRVGTDGRLHIGGVSQSSTPLEAREMSSTANPISSEDILMHPSDRFQGNSNVLSLARYSVCEPNKIEEKDDFLSKEQTPLDRAAASAKWAEAHLAPRRLPDECLASPVQTEQRSTRKRHMTANAVRVHVCTSSGVVHHVELRDGLESRVGEVLQEVALREPDAAAASKLEFKGDILEASQTLASYGIEHGDRLMLQRDGEVAVAEALRVKKPVIDSTADEVLCAFINVPLMRRYPGNSNILQVGTGAAVAAAVAPRQNWSNTVSHSGWRQPGRDLPKMSMLPPPKTPPIEELIAYLQQIPPPRTPSLHSEVPSIPSTPGAQNVGHEITDEVFQLETPVNQYIDEATKRVIMVDKTGQRAAVFPEGVVPLSEHPMRDWVIDLYMKHAPEKITNVDRLLWDGEGKEGELRELLVDAYGRPDKPYEEYVSERRARRNFNPKEAVQRFHDEQTANEVCMDEENNFYVNYDEKKVPISEHATRQWVIDFLKHQDNGKLPEVDLMMWEYQWEEEKLRKKLQDDYGEAPIQPYNDYMKKHNQRVSERRQRSASPAPDQSVLRRRSTWLEVDDGRGSIYYFNQLDGISKWAPNGTPFENDPAPSPSPAAQPFASPSPAARIPSSSALSSSTVHTDYSYYTTLTQ
eukprot:TRINITY_DN13651_c0_g2_i1.p1 TRINITY_DN13651_c0_g2~~TRINITY_DN13651_c0_g2_i1.p1  ORF type:complete len:708 (+),score=154.70 TRINITY_DN13651_c0_g2_i1:67-2190(+)